jgi:hypothetical protein
LTLVIKLRGQGILYREGQALTSARYDLQMRFSSEEETKAPSARIWKGTVVVLRPRPPLVEAETLWLHLTDEGYWLPVLVAGRFPLYFTRSLTPLQNSSSAAETR